VLAGAAIKALGQLRVAVEQLEEAKKDRHTLVFADLGRRWDEPAMSEALQMAPRFSREALARVVAKAYRGVSWNPLRNRATARANHRMNILLRVPNFFEDLALLVESGSLDLGLVSKNFKGVAVREWHFWEFAIKELRQEDPWSYTQFEELVRRMEALPDE